MSGGKEEAIYVSPGSWKSLWQEYTIFSDHLELGTVFGKMIVPMKDILGVEVRPALVIGDIFRGKSLLFSLALKLDFADLCSHIAIHRRSGIFRHIRFSPADPEKFLEKCAESLKPAANTGD